MTTSKSPILAEVVHRSIRKLLTNRLIALTIPDKPNSRLQRYRLTEKGRAALAATSGHSPA